MSSVLGQKKDTYPCELTQKFAAMHKSENTSKQAIK